MLALPRLTGPAVAFIAALASYRPMPAPPSSRRAGRRGDEQRPAAGTAPRRSADSDRARSGSFRATR